MHDRRSWQKYLEDHGAALKGHWVVHRKDTDPDQIEFADSKSYKRIG